MLKQDNAEGGINDDEPGTMVVDFSQLLNGRRFWRRPLRAHRPYTDLEQVAAIVVRDHTTHDRSAPPAILDTGTWDDHALHHLIAGDDLE